MRYHNLIRKFKKSQSLYKYLIIILVFLFFLVPGRQGWFDGIPLSQFHELVFLTLLAMLFLFLPTDQFKAITKGAKRITFFIVIALIFLIVLKIALGQISLQKGLVGSYYYPSLENGTLEKSTEFFKFGINGTRIDEEVNFKALGYSFTAKPFPLWFFNNIKDRIG